MPATSKEIFRQLNINKKELFLIRFNKKFMTLLENHTINKPSIIFQRITHPI